MLIFQIKRIISSEKWFDYVVTVFFFCFFENAKNLGRSDDAKWREKRGWPKALINITLDEGLSGVAFTVIG